MSPAFQSVFWIPGPRNSLSKWSEAACSQFTGSVLPRKTTVTNGVDYGQSMVLSPRAVMMQDGAGVSNLPCMVREQLRTLRDLGGLSKWL